MVISLPIIAIIVVSIGLVLGLLVRNSASVELDTTPISSGTSMELSPLLQRDHTTGRFRLDAASGLVSGGLDAIFTPTTTKEPAREHLLAVPRSSFDSIDTGTLPSNTDAEEKLALATLVCDAFPFDRFMCSHVVWAESLSGGSGCAWRPVVYGPCWSYTMDCGLLQTNIVHAGKYEDLGYSIYVGCWIPEVNIMVAQRIYEEQGPCAWVAYGC